MSKLMKLIREYWPYFFIVLGILILIYMANPNK